MRKLFTLCVLLTMAVLNLCAKDITVYVQASAAPHIHYWGNAGNSEWPGEMMTETKTLKNPTTKQEQTFYVKKFINMPKDGVVNIIFNNGPDKQTHNIEGITSDSYFTYDGESGYEDITSQYGIRPICTVAGVPTSVFETEWDDKNDANIMQEQPDGTYLWKKTITLSEAEAADKQNLAFKVVINPGNTWLPKENFYYGDLLQRAGTFDVSITFNPENDNIAMTATQDVTIPSAGYATFVPSVKTNFSALGITAYTVKVTDASVTLSPIEHEVLPGTPVVLKGAEQTYKAAAIWANKEQDSQFAATTELKVSDGKMTGAGLVYVLADKSKGVGFYRLAESVTIPAGKCYLSMPIEAGAKDFIGFETTGISHAAMSATANDAMYNLSGQRVDSTYKGIVIKNGKKILNK